MHKIIKIYKFTVKNKDTGCLLTASTSIINTYSSCSHSNKADFFLTLKSCHGAQCKQSVDQTADNLHTKISHGHGKLISLINKTEQKLLGEYNQPFMPFLNFLQKSQTLHKTQKNRLELAGRDRSSHGLTDLLKYMPETGVNYVILYLMQILICDAQIYQDECIA